MAVHRESGGFVIRIELSAEFDDAYEGDDDGYAWLAHFRANVQPRIVRAVFAELRADGTLDAVPASRGQNPEAETEIAVRRKPSKR